VANLNKTMLIGRLTRDPEAIVIQGVPAGARIGFVVNNRSKNKQTGQYEDVPCWLNCEVWNRGENKMGDRVMATLKKGAQIFIEGHLKYEEWDDKNGGGKRHDVKVVVDNFQYLDKKEEGQGVTPARQQHAGRPQQGGGYGQRPQQQGGRPGYGGGNGGGYGGYGGGDYEDDMGGPGPGGPGQGDPEQDIPF
jgi:single-strand DNA-binding protein